MTPKEFEDEMKYGGVKRTNTDGNIMVELMPHYERRDPITGTCISRSGKLARKFEARVVDFG